MHAFFEAADTGPELVAVRAAMLQVDLIALRLRVAMAKADVQMRSATCAARRIAVDRLRSRTAREEQRDHLEELRTAVRCYAQILGSVGTPRERVIGLVRETVEQVMPVGASDSTAVTAAVVKALELYYDAPAA